MAFRIRRTGWTGLRASTWRPCGRDAFSGPRKPCSRRTTSGAFLSLNEWNTRYITSTYTPLWTTGSSGLRYAMLCRDADQPILYEQGDIGYHTRRLAPWLGDENVKYAITGMG